MAKPKLTGPRPEWLKVRLRADEYDDLTLLMFAWVVARSILVGVILGWRVHRYILSAWVPLLFCASRMLVRRSPSSVQEVRGVAGRGEGVV